MFGKYIFSYRREFSLPVLGDCLRLAYRGGTLDFRDVPSAVGGDISLRHGIILAKSIPEAKKQCPGLMLVPPNYEGTVPGTLGRRIRHLGMHTSRTRKDNPGRQISLFDEIAYEKLTVMDRTIDAIRERFGIDSIKRAVFLNQPLDYMCSGIPNATKLR